MQAERDARDRDMREFEAKQKQPDAKGDAPPPPPTDFAKFARDRELERELARLRDEVRAMNETATSDRRDLREALNKLAAQLRDLERRVAKNERNISTHDKSLSGHDARITALEQKKPPPTTREIHVGPVEREAPKQGDTHLHLQCGLYGGRFAGLRRWKGHQHCHVAWHAIWLCRPGGR